MWIDDFLRDEGIENVRVSTFGYDAKLNDGFMSTISDYASSLLLGVESLRKSLNSVRLQTFSRVYTCEPSNPADFSSNHFPRPLPRRLSHTTGNTALTSFCHSASLTPSAGIAGCGPYYRGVLHRSFPIRCALQWTGEAWLPRGQTTNRHNF